MKAEPTGDLRAALDHERDELVGVRERVVERPVVAVGTVTHDTAAHLHELAHRRVGDRRPGVDEGGHERPDGVVEPQRAASASCSSAVAVKVFECDAIRNRSVVVRRRPASTSA